ncbi:proline iminopeptidase-family hydrolase [Micromonospora lupini]|uniref:proline iminopeptidase-family hydrolase n=1 Tax=Micromonospora lupini TaxID=285679 RepID=UPI0033D4F01A
MAAAGGALSAVSAGPAAASVKGYSEPGERFIDVPGGRVWAKVTGSGPGVPLLVLHGGPGAGHDYLEPLAALADDRPVIFYDQLGCGRSDIPDDSSLWTIDRFLAELEAVRRALGLRRVHLYGHSSGGWLAIEYLAGRPRGVASAVLASTSASAAEYSAGTRHLRTRLPKAVQETLDRYEAREDYTATEYQAAVQVFYDNFFYRQSPPPELLLRGLENLQNSHVYPAMWGPNEFVATGSLRNWDRVPALRKISTPVLLTRGHYDEFDVRCTNTLQRHLPNAERADFAASAHFAMLEEQKAYVSRLRSFLRRLEK